MKGVFLHVLGDALGSVVVIVSAIIYLTIPKICGGGGGGGGGMVERVLTTAATAINGSTTLMAENVTEITCSSEMVAPGWVNYVDPILSLILVTIILSTSVPLVRDSGLILLQTVPTHIVVSQMQSELEQLDGVLAVHEFHVWSLAGDKIVASLHLHLRSLEDYVRISNEVKEYFHDEGIHSVTIQPEFLELHVKKAGRDCVLECGPEKDCHTATCCSIPKKTQNGNGLKDHQTKAMDNDTNQLQAIKVVPPQNVVNQGEAVGSGQIDVTVLDSAGA